MRNLNIQSTSIYLLLDSFSDLVIDSGWNWDIMLLPRCVGNCWHFDWWEEIFTKMTTLRVILCKTILVKHHEVMNEIMFSWPKESRRVSFVKDVMVLLSIVTGRNEQWRMGI